MNRIDFTDKVAIITGASSGIGAEIAISFAGYGARLTLVGRDETRLLKTANECMKQNNLVPLWLQLDLTDPGSCETVINKTVEMYEQIDILVNCAGKIQISSVFDESMEVFDDLMNINFRVPYRMTQLAIPYLLKTKGNIVNIGSSLSKHYKPGSLIYAISKAALEMFSKHTAPELTMRGVRINTISPGITKTNILNYLNMHDEHSKELFYKTMAKKMPHGRVLEPKEIAKLVCVTASAMFPNLNGSDLLLDGASSMV